MVEVDTEDLVDARAVADLLGLNAGPKAVSVYRRRHDDFPEPVINLGVGRCLLWRRQDIEEWAKDRRQR